VTVCVAGTVRDTEAEDVPLGEPLVVLRAERVWDRVTETVPVWDTEGVEEGDTEPLPRPGLPEGELEPLDAGVAEPHTVAEADIVRERGAVADAVEVTDSRGEAVPLGIVEGVTVADADCENTPVTVPEGDTENSGVPVAAGETVAAALSVDVVLAVPVVCRIEVVSPSL
jgi:hypothetical protein